MDSTRQHLQEQQSRAAGLAGELRQLHKDGSASAAELREFLGQLKGRSPEEVMGAVAQSGLIQSTLIAAVGCVALLIVCTIVPYALTDASPHSDQPQAATPVTDSAPVNSEPGEAADAAVAGDPTTPPDSPDLERAAEAMGIGDAVEADPNQNPLDSKLDKLLDGID